MGRSETLPQGWSEGPFPSSRQCFANADASDREGTSGQASTLSATNEAIRLEDSQKKEGRLNKGQAVGILSELGRQHWIGDFNILLGVADVRLNSRLQTALTYNMETIKKFVDAAFLLECKNLEKCSYDDIRNLLETNRTAFGEGFMTPEATRDVLINLFMHNFGCIETAAAFGLLFRKWFDRKNGKKNTIILIGEPSSGKTWLAKGWLHLARFWGKINAWVKNGQFTFGGCVSGRIIFHDECMSPLEDTGYFEDLKKIYAGENCPINVKYLSGSVSCGMPVIGTCNSFPIRAKDQISAFNTRCEFINWSGVEICAEQITGLCNPKGIFLFNDWCNSVFH